MELRLYIRQAKQYDIYNNSVYYHGSNPYNLQKATGTLPASRQWKDQNGVSIYNQYYDVTDYVSDLYNLQLEWNLDRDVNGEIIPGSFQSKKGSTGSIIFEGKAYQYIKQWLQKDESAPLNTVEVQIEHVGCCKYIDWVITPEQLEWCEDDICTYDVVIQQQEEALRCIQNTLITDNHQGWFGNDTKVPVSGKQHPRFSYCNEIRPNGILVLHWWIASLFMTISLAVIIPLVQTFNILIDTIDVFVKVINALASLVGGKGIQGWDKNKYKVTGKDVKEEFGQYFMEAAGCGREHPAPLIRDYISNVCSKCGVQVDEITAPLFFSRTLTLETSTDRQTNAGESSRYNPYYNACYFNAPKERGIRRDRSLNLLNQNTKNTTDFWLPDNSPLLTLDLLLDQLNTVFNTIWRVTDNKLYIQRKDFWLDENYKYDFSENGADRVKLLKGLCFKWNEIRPPAYIDGLYAIDPSDKCGNEALKQMNGIVNLGLADNNPKLSGKLDKTVQFGGTKFRLDGASTDYIYDAAQVVVNGTFLSGNVFGMPAFKDAVLPYIRDYADYALMLDNETAALPKILCWDGQSYLNAKCVKPYSAAFIANYTAPSPNPRYNNYPVTLFWQAKHSPETFVIGSALTLGNQPYGYYKVQSPFGTPLAEQPALLVNYPMYYEPGFQGTLFDLFHWIDDPILNPQKYQNWTATINLCCEDIQNCGVQDAAENIILGQRVKLPDRVDGVIKGIKLDYNGSSTYGRNITLTGTA